MREVERQVMLRIIDQNWREHLDEMDYLREGINLRAMGQKDPLIEWQREGFDMFGQMMHGIWQDFVRYVMHVQVKVTAARRRDGPGRRQGRPQDATPSAPSDAAAGRARRASRTTGPTPRCATSATRRPTTPTVAAARPACGRGAGRGGRDRPAAGGAGGTATERRQPPPTRRW